MEGLDEIGIELPRSSHVAKLDDGSAVIQQLFQLTDSCYRAELTLWGEGSPKRFRASATSSKQAIADATKLLAAEINGKGKNGGRKRNPAGFERSAAL